MLIYPQGGNPNYSSTEWPVDVSVAPAPTPTPTPTPFPCPILTPGPNLAKPILVVDSSGKSVTGVDGGLVYRPDDGHDPDYFILHGRSSTPVTYIYDLVSFRQFGLWDEQRINGIFYDQFVDYANISIGIYGAANNPVSQNELLNIANQYARFRSRFRANAQPDKQHPYLRHRNVMDVQLGYKLFASGAFGKC